MLFVTALSLFLLIWSGLFLLDYCLRYLNYQCYVEFAERNGLHISPFQLRMYTAKYDEVNLSGQKRITEEGGLRLRLKKIWFDIGTVAALLCTVFITWYLSRLLWNDVHVITGIFHSPEKTTVDEPINIPDPEQKLQPEQIVYAGDGDGIDHPGEQGLTPILPGVNMPWEHIPLFMIVLIVAAVLHELGHSWSATCENVQVNGFGVFVIGLYPGAFTEIDDQSMRRCSSWSRLRIYTGGIWHNLLLALLGYFLVLHTPLLMTPFFVSGQGVTVDEVSHQSGLYGGLLPGQVVVGMDDCKVHDLSTWSQCVHDIQRQKHGRCVDGDTVRRSRGTNVQIFDTEIHCCDATSNATTAAHICFESETIERSVRSETTAPSLARALLGRVERPKEIRRIREKLTRELSCLNARWVTEQPMCNDTVQCEKTTVGETSKPMCIYPALYNGTQLVRVEIANSSKAVLFVGRVEEFLYLVEVSPLVARWFWVPKLLPHSFELLFKYLLTLSLALGVLNAVPCHALDGHHIVVTVVQRVFRMQPKRRRHLISRIILSYGSFLLAANILIGFIRLFRNFSIL